MHRKRGNADLKDQKYDEESYCAYCEHATRLHGDEFVLCEKKGVVRAAFVCRKFSYDPLKHRPQKAAPPKLEYVDLDS